MGRTACCSRRQFLRGSLAVAGLGLLAGCGLLPSPAQSPKVPVVGVLSGFSQIAAQSITDAFPQGLRELG
jgi:hypothetical protein